MVNYINMENTSNIFKRIIEQFLSSISEPLMTRSIGEYLWGYEDPLLHELKSLFPELVSDDRVALFGSVVSAFPNVNVFFKFVVLFR
jgi:hypothetical protein